MPPPRKSEPVDSRPALHFRPRVVHRGEIALGPGKAELLTAIREHGSIAHAAKTMEMSYMRAWTLVKIMNHAFRGPLVTIGRGGVKGGEARLTPLGREVLGLYDTIVRRSRAAARSEWTRLRRQLKKEETADRAPPAPSR